VQALLEPFARVVGLTFTLFLFLMFFLILVYFKTETIILPIMLFIAIVGSISLSTLFASQEHPLIPAPFDTILYLIVAGGIAFLIYRIWFK